MTAVTDAVSASDVEELARKAGITVCWARARCEHGKTREQLCSECEGGYIQDARTFFKPRWDVVLAGATDDGESVAYIPYSPENAQRLLAYRQAHRDLCERTLELLPEIHAERAVYDPDIGKKIGKRSTPSKQEVR